MDAILLLAMIWVGVSVARRAPAPRRYVLTIAPVATALLLILGIALPLRAIHWTIIGTISSVLTGGLITASLLFVMWRLRRWPAPVAVDGYWCVFDEARDKLRNELAMLGDYSMGSSLLGGLWMMTKVLWLHLTQ